jgi:hypothetical protein
VLQHIRVVRLHDIYTLLALLEQLAASMAAEQVWGTRTGWARVTGSVPPFSVCMVCHAQQRSSAFNVCTQHAQPEQKDDSRFATPNLPV